MRICAIEYLQDDPSDRICGKRAVLEEFGVGRIPPFCHIQTKCREEVGKQRLRNSGPRRRFCKRDEDRVVRPPIIRGIELRLPVVELPEPLLRRIVPLIRKVVGCTREGIHCTDIGALVAREEQGGNREVFVVAAGETLAPGESAGDISCTGNSPPPAPPLPPSGSRGDGSASSFSHRARICLSP